MITIPYEKLNFHLGCAIEYIVCGNINSAIFSLRKEIHSKGCSRCKAVKISIVNDVIHGMTFYLGASVKHIFNYTRNNNKAELRVALKYLLEEQKHNEEDTVPECERSGHVGDTTEQVLPAEVSG